MHVIRWSRYPTLATNDDAKWWLQSVADFRASIQHRRSVWAWGRAIFVFQRINGSAAKQSPPGSHRRLCSVCFLEEAEH